MIRHDISLCRSPLKFVVERVSFCWGLGVGVEVFVGFWRFGLVGWFVGLRWHKTFQSRLVTVT